MGRTRIAELEARLIPRIALEFDLNDSQCLVDSSEQDAIVIGSAYRIIRIRLRNTGGQRLERVRVFVDAIGQRMPLGEQPLQFLRDLGEDVPPEPGLPPPTERRRRYPNSVRGYDLAPHEVTYINLLFKTEGGNESDQFTLYFANPIPAMIPAIPRRVGLVAYADDSRPFRAAANISLDDRQRPNCELDVVRELVR